MNKNTNDKICTKFRKVVHRATNDLHLGNETHLDIDCEIDK